MPVWQHADTNQVVEAHLNKTGLFNELAVWTNSGGVEGALCQHLNCVKKKRIFLKLEEDFIALVTLQYNVESVDIDYLRGFDGDTIKPLILMSEEER